LISTELLNSSLIFFSVRNSPNLAKAGSFFMFLGLTIRHTHTHTHTRLNEYSARCRGCYLYKTRQTQTFMSSAGFESANPAIERPQNYTLARTANGISNSIIVAIQK